MGQPCMCFLNCRVWNNPLYRPRWGDTAPSASQDLLGIISCRRAYFDEKTGFLTSYISGVLETYILYLQTLELGLSTLGAQNTDARRTREVGRLICWKLTNKKRRVEDSDTCHPVDGWLHLRAFLRPLAAHHQQAASCHQRLQDIGHFLRFIKFAQLPFFANFLCFLLQRNHLEAKRFPALGQPNSVVRA